MKQQSKSSKPRKPLTLPEEYVFKAMWRATAVCLTVQGKDYADALARAERMVMSMEGGVHCQEIKMIKQTR